ncbi:MAG TPA: PVC-type heme-binding CxxCH protein [Pirellulaceae bacterium]|nr:PVC-type heme-binding CxxCH protein [Pirellulaceae bacterium]
MLFCRRILYCIVALSATALSAAEPLEISSPLTPDEAQKLFQLADTNLQIELAAAEPEVVDPVAIRFDEDGRMWVCEMRDYPLGPPPGTSKSSRIRVLEDTDGDGRFEKATTFADGLSFVTGLQPWKGGVFVTLSGAVAYMKDTDGDGKCDLDETWFEGFAEQNTQLRANHPKLALDNWIYVANGLRGGKVISRKLKEQGPIDISGMDFRFDPLTGKAEAVSGNGQFGLTFDDWGNRFLCSNRNPCRHVVIEDRYLKANPGVTVAAVVHDVAAFAENSRIYPISRAWTTSNLHAGQFTAACGVYIYRGDLLPQEFYGNVFTCDPTGNLVHREIMQPAGPTFTSKPAYEGKEFLASPDEWFRPVNMELGPDGALYVVDMYRAVIEHPDWVPDELKRRPDQRLGDDRGRIWRIVGSDRRAEPEASTRRPSPKLSQADSDDLLPLLGHKSAWHRETAQRLLLERQRQALAPRLRELATSGDNSQARARALRLLSGQAQLEPQNVVSALEDADPCVRALAVQIVESFAEDSELRSKASGLVSDPDPAVRFQSRLSVRGGLNPFLHRSPDIDDPWMRVGILLAYKPETAALSMRKFFPSDASAPAPSRGWLSFLNQLAEYGMGSKVASVRDLGIRAVVDELNDGNQPASALSALHGVVRGMARRGVPLSKIDMKEQSWSNVAERVAAIANGESTPLELRLVAIDVLGYLPATAAVLQPFCERERDQDLRIAALSSLARQGEIDLWHSLIDTFASELPPVRRAIVDGMLANTVRTNLLLDAIEAAKIKPSELDAAHVTRLTQHRDPAIKERAAKLFAAATPAERAKALADYQPVLKMNADAARGKAIFEKNCAACHKIGGIGTNVAPDISDSRTKKLDQLLGDILLPNRAIDNNYIGYNVRLLDGTVTTGVLSAETSTSITLRQQGGKEAVIPRSEIEELKSSGLSLMPEGLEKQIPHQDMADLLAFIKNWRYLDGRTPLGEPISR